jgi:hypothetical protein
VLVLYRGTGPLALVDGMMNSNKHKPILVTTMVPELEKYGASGDAFFLTRPRSMPCIQESEEIFI